MTEIYISYLIRQPILATAVFISIIPILLTFVRKTYIDPVFLILLIYLILKFLLDLTMFHYASNRANNIIFGNVIVIMRYCLCSSMFLHRLESRFFRKVLWYTIVGFIIFSCWDFLSINPDLLNTHDHKEFLYASTIECILMIFWILLYFYETIRSLKIPNLLSYPFFWVCAGMLLYYSSIVFIAPLFHYTYTWENWIDIGFLVYVPSIFESINMIFFSIGICFFSARYYAQQ